MSLPPFISQSYLQTSTSSGWRVLGVMIQGATLNTTLSVKMGVSGIPCRNVTEAAESHPLFPPAWYRSAITLQPPVNHCVHTPFLAKNYFTCWGTDFTRPKRAHCDMRHQDVSGSPVCCKVGAPLTSHRCLVGLWSEEFGGKVDTSNILCFLGFYAARQGWRNCPQLFSRQNIDQNYHTASCLPLKVQKFDPSEQAAFFNAWFTFGKFLQVQLNSNLVTIPVFFLLYFLLPLLTHLTSFTSLPVFPFSHLEQVVLPHSSLA